MSARAGGDAARSVPWGAASDDAVSDDAASRPPEPTSDARALFAAALPVARGYAALLAGPGTERGLLGPREIGRLWDRHLVNCGLLAALLPPPATAPTTPEPAGLPATPALSTRLVDIGSGAGLPGIVLALLRPDLAVSLLEPLARRAAFLEECVAVLGLPRVSVHRVRAEEARAVKQPHRGKQRGRSDASGGGWPALAPADVATARAVAPLDRLARWCLPLLRPGGTLLALKGDRAAEELAGARGVLRELGVREAEVVTARMAGVAATATVVRIVRPEVGR